MGYRWSTSRSIRKRFVLTRLPFLIALLWCLLLPLSQTALAQRAETPTSDRRFRQNLCIEYLANLEIPSQSFDGMTVGGLSAIAYDPKTGQFYTLSDDHGSGQARIYELDLPITEDSSVGNSKTESGKPDAEIAFGPATVKSVIYLKNSEGEPYSGSFDPEGLALTPQGSFYVSTEGEPSQGLAPGLFEFDRATGDLLRELPVPEKFTPRFAEQTTGDSAQPVQLQGVQSNQGFESLSLSATGSAPGDPLRLFTATEGPLAQDKTARSINGTPRDRLLHYYLGEGRPLLVAEHLYPLASLPGSVFHGLSEILVLDGEGHFLGLERALTPLGFDIKLFQFTLAGASDISGRASLRGSLRDVQPIQKQLLLNLNELGIGLDNLEGMSWGPRFKDGSRSLLIISDDNFKSFQKTQILMFKLSQSSATR